MPEHGAPHDDTPAFYPAPASRPVDESVFAPTTPAPPRVTEESAYSAAPAAPTAPEPATYRSAFADEPYEAARNGHAVYPPAEAQRSYAEFDDHTEPAQATPTFHGYPDSYRAAATGAEVDERPLLRDGGLDGGAGEPPPLPPHATAIEEEPAPVERRRSGAGLLREILETVILAAIIFLAVRAVVQNFKVEGSSMVPSFVDGEYMLVNKAIYTRIDLRTVHKFLPFVSAGANPEHYILHGPQHGDVIVFHPPPAAGGDKRDFIKRVIGVPGDTIDFRDSHVVVNGQLLVEPYITAPTTCQGQFCHVVLGKDQLFVMGDNRTNSSDSRFWGPVAADKIIGKALLIYWCGGTTCKSHTDKVGLAPNHQPPTAKPVK
ncbi:MAG: signal peptidase I [Dehalococcoidia bacterium]